MFLDSIAVIGLLSHDPTTNLLSRFPPPIIAQVAGCVASCLCSNGASKQATLNSILPTTAHVNWVFEVLGGGLSLSVADHYQTIDNCISICDTWGVHENAPQCFQVETQTYLVKIIKMLSILFDHRSTTPDEIQLHAQVCKKAINVYHGIAKAGRCTKETYEVFILVLLGIGDNLLGPKNDALGLGRTIAPHLLQLIYDIWFYSRSHDDRLWEVFSDLHKKWIHFQDPILQWGATVTSVTHTIIVKQFLPEERLATKLLINLSKDLYSSFEVSSDIHYFWIRFLKLLGNPNVCQMPDLFSLWMKAYRNVANKLLFPIQKNEYGAPDGNTVLNIIGAHLLQAMLINRVSHFEGTSTAIETVCSIFVTCKETEFDVKYLAAFYQAAQSILQCSPDSPVFSTMLMCSQGIIANGITGYRVLIPFLIFGIESLLNYYGPIQVSLDTIRNSCFAILGYIICLASSFGNAKFLRFPQPTQFNSNPPVLCYPDLEPHIGNILLSGLLTEKNNENIVLLLSLSVLFLNEYLIPVYGELQQEFSVTAPQNCPGQTSQVFAWSFLMALIEKLNNNEYLPDIFVCVLNSLCDIVPILHYIPNYQSFRTCFIWSVCDIIQKLLPLVQPNASANQPIMSQRDAVNVLCVAYRACIHFALGGEWFSDPGDPQNLPDMLSAQRKLIAMLLKGMDMEGMKINSKRNSLSEVNETASWCLDQLMNNLNAFPSTAGFERLSATISEEQIFRAIASKVGIPLHEIYKFVRYFAISNNSLITMIDLSPLLSEDMLVNTLIIRTPNGKFAWQSILQLVSPAELDDSKEQYSQYKLRQNAIFPFISKYAREKSLSERQFESFVAYLNELAKNPQFITQVIPQVAKVAADYDVKNHFGLSTQSPAVNPMPLKNSEFAMNAIGSSTPSLMISHLTLFESSFHDIVFPLIQSPALSEGLKILDSIPEREFVSVSILATPKGVHSENELYSTAGSAELNSFCTSLGNTVIVSSFKGYIGQLDHSEALGKYSVYFADNEIEVMYHLIPFIECDVKLKKVIVSKSKIVIVWATDNYFNPNILTDLTAYLFIIITPRTNGFYNICFMLNPLRSPPNDPLSLIIAPAINNTVISKISLPSVIRRVIKNSLLRMDSSSSSEQLISCRERYLSDFIHQQSDFDHSFRSFHVLFQEPMNSGNLQPPPAWDSLGVSVNMNVNNKENLRTPPLQNSQRRMQNTQTPHVIMGNSFRPISVGSIPPPSNASRPLSGGISVTSNSNIQIHTSGPSMSQSTSPIIPPPGGVSMPMSNNTILSPPNGSSLPSPIQPPSRPPSSGSLLPPSSLNHLNSCGIIPPPNSGQVPSFSNQNSRPSRPAPLVPPSRRGSGEFSNNRQTPTHPQYVTLRNPPISSPSTDSPPLTIPSAGSPTNAQSFRMAVPTNNKRPTGRGMPLTQRNFNSMTLRPTPSEPM